MSVLPKTKSFFLLNLLRIYDKSIYKAYKEILRVEDLSIEELKKFQENKLKELLIYSFKHVPYYKKILFEAKVISSNLEVNLENFNNIPILTKDIIRKEFENLKSDQIHKFKWKENTSGGSTGEPVRFIQDNHYNSFNVANKLYYKKSAGVSFGDRELRFWGSSRDIEGTKSSFFLKLRDKIYNRVDINSSILSKEKLIEYINYWNKYKPQWVEAYVHIIVEIANFAKKENLKLYQPKGILCTAGTLDDDMKDLLKKIFNCKIYNRYGSREVGDMAFNSSLISDLLRISVWNQKIEIINENMQETKDLGDVYVTNLNNYSMPLIRYEIGDIAQKANTWGHLKKVQGRVNSLFKLKNGDLIDGGHFRTFLFFEDSIKKYQIIQKKFDLIIIKIVLKKNFKKIENTKKEKITSKIKKYMGDNCEVKFEFVKEIKATKSGKFLYTICEVK